MVIQDYDDSIELVQIWLQLFLYIAVKHIFSQLLILATFANFLSVRAIYVMVEALQDKRIQASDKVLLLGTCLLVLSSLVFGTLEVALAYAILGELLLFMHQYTGGFNPLSSAVWALTFIFIEFTPTAVLAVSCQSLYAKKSSVFNKNIKNTGPAVDQKRPNSPV